MRYGKVGNVAWGRHTFIRFTRRIYGLLPARVVFQVYDIRLVLLLQSF
jgi:hypothetical protein